MSLPWLLMQEVIHFLCFLVLKRKSLPWFAHRNTLCYVLPYFWSLCWTNWYNSASFRGEKLVAQATKSELLLPTPFCVTVMAVERFRRFSFNSDHSCSNVEYSFLLFFIKKGEKSPTLWCWCTFHFYSWGCTLAMASTWLLFSVIALKASLILRLC